MFFESFTQKAIKAEIPGAVDGQNGGVSANLAAKDRTKPCHAIPVCMEARLTVPLVTLV